jgi:transmembrane sensor
MSTIDREAMQWLLRSSGRALDVRERAEFDRWYGADIRHQGAYLRARAINNALERATVQESLRPARQRLEHEWAGASWKQPSPRRTFLRFGALAASVAALAATTLFFGQDSGTIITTARGELRKVPLADHSVATVNSDSQVRVSMGRAAREVELVQGEACFEVAQDKARPFLVEAGDARVRAVGTEFSVRRHAGGAEVLVTEGVVEVWSSGGTAGKRRLAAGERAFVSERAASISVVRQPEEVARKLAWREGRLIFMNQTLADAVADFNRYSAKPIVIVDPALNSKIFVGQYQINAPELFAKDVSAFLGVPIDVGADRIRIGAGRGNGPI